MYPNSRQELKAYQQPTRRRSGDSSVSYDYSGLDRQNEAVDSQAPLEGAKKAALYGGDIAAAMAAGSRIRDLQRIAAQPAFARVRSASSSSSSVGGGGAYELYESPSAVTEKKKKEE